MTRSQAMGSSCRISSKASPSMRRCAAGSRPLAAQSRSAWSSAAALMSSVATSAAPPRPAWMLKPPV